MSDVTLLSAITESRRDVDPGVTVVNISGDPAAGAIVGAVQFNYHRILKRERPDPELLESLIGEKVTLVLSGENMLGAGMIIAREGRLFAGSRGGVSILPKGKRSKGYRVDPRKVMDVFPGWVADDASSLVDTCVGQYPQLRNLTQERLNELPRDSNECSLAVFGRNPNWGAPDCVWLIGEYWPEDDICDTNVLLIREQFGTSEHGSCFGRDLVNNRALGEVVGFTPIPFADALDLCNLDFDEALERVFS